MKSSNKKKPKQIQPTSIKKKEQQPNKTKVNSKPASAPSFSKFLVHVLFFILSIFLLFIYFSIGNNKSWFGDKIIGYWDEFNEQKDQLNLEYRKNMRLGKTYSDSKTIADNLKVINGNKDAVVLMPPTAYLKSKGLDYHVPEPAVFYYYTGVKTVWSNSVDMNKVNWSFDYNNGRMLLTKIEDTIQLKNILASFNKFKPTL